MKTANPKVTFGSDYLMQLAMSQAEQLPMFNGHELVAEIEIDEDSRFSGISVSLKEDESK